MGESEILIVRELRGYCELLLNVNAELGRIACQMKNGSMGVAEYKEIAGKQQDLSSTITTVVTKLVNNLMAALRAA